MVVTQQCGAARLTVRGPETKATTVPVLDAEFFGIQFSLGTFMPSPQPGHLVDRSLALPQVANGWFWLNGSAWEVPDRTTPMSSSTGSFALRLLVRDPVVSEALHGQVKGLSTRSVERRVSRATGLTRGAIGQIRRAERAVELLSRGMSPSTRRRAPGTPTSPT